MIGVIGLNHTTAPVEVREKFTFRDQQYAAAYKALSSVRGVRECMLLSTCNRTEVYFEYEESAAVHIDVRKELCRMAGVDEAGVKPHFYFLEDEDAVMHMAAVAAGIDSMVLGEPQVFGQVKDAYGRALELGAAKKTLSRIVEGVCLVAKKARTETDISKGASSISSAAVELARKIFGRLNDKTVLVIGAGEMAELALKYLYENGASSVIIANRSYEKAVVLSETYNGKARRFDEIEQSLCESDIVISSTNSPHYVLRADQVAGAIRKRKNRPIFVIDIAVPRDVEPGVNNIENVYLYNIDDLQEVVRANFAMRKKEVEKAKEIIARGVKSVTSKVGALDADEIIVALRARLEGIRKQETESMSSSFRHMDPEQVKKVEYLTEKIVKSILNNPMTALKKHAGSPSFGLYADAIKEMFGLLEEKPN